MDQAILQLLNGDLSVEVLLVLFILGMLTKRFVPWWVYEEALEELDKYEHAAPQLIDSIDRLTDELRAQGYESQTIEQAENATNRVRRRSPDEHHQDRSHSERGVQSRPRSLYPRKLNREQ